MRHNCTLRTHKLSLPHTFSPSRHLRGETLLSPGNWLDPQQLSQHSSWEVWRMLQLQCSE